MKPKKICLICFEPLDRDRISKICRNCWDKKDISVEAQEDEEEE